MKILIVNTSEKTGGAAIAASRLVKALCRQGLDAKMLVAKAQTGSPRVVALKPYLRYFGYFLVERTIVWMANRWHWYNLFGVDVAAVGCDITQTPEFREADIIHLHWVNQAMLSLRGIRKILESGKPVVWTMHDMWPCTGICHYATNCTRYTTEEGCSQCQELKYPSPHDLSARVFGWKSRLFSEHRIHFIACSRWLEQSARVSSLFRNQPIRCIHNAIDSSIFHHRGGAEDTEKTLSTMNEARSALGLPGAPEMRLLLFASLKVTDERKGLKYLVEAANILHKEYGDLRNLGFVVLGNRSEEVEKMLPFPVYSLGYVTDEHKMATVYRACDLFVTPALFENLPNTIAEASACGTPCVGFNTGGIPEMIDHKQTGYVAQYKDSADMARGIHYLLCEADYRVLSRHSVQKADAEYSEHSVVEKHLAYYRECLGECPPSQN
jgi:glycosyltransferase involved in cell wall biosynthesis